MEKLLCEGTEVRCVTVDSFNGKIGTIIELRTGTSYIYRIKFLNNASNNFTKYEVRPLTKLEKALK